ncbi:isoprenylcysteine carboxylmethyltransferase family protein [Pseudescherichia vulneris]|uniref:methyltransferase family protein n=1 Tax=Pseudescherichia vulneris TaxID=566 RepID=UPI0028D23E43|nr:isoprenylcysteine carboxylmethyltransferase family protein [Pseudescherichia vulneris]
MRVTIGNFLFRTRNALFPLLYLTLFVSQQQVSQNAVAMLLAGAAVALLGQGIRVLTVGLDYIVRGGRQRKVYADSLVQTGLFAHCRNPLYLGNLLMIIGFGVAANNPWYLAIAMPLFFLGYACIIAAEECYLLERFGDDYRHYCARTPRLLPRLAGMSETLRTFAFNWRRVVVKEYTTLCMTLLMLVLLAARALHADAHGWIISAGLIILILLACCAVRILKKSGRLHAGSPRQ